MFKVKLVLEDIKYPRSGFDILLSFKSHDVFSEWNWYDILSATLNALML